MSAICILIPLHEISNVNGTIQLYKHGNSAKHIEKFKHSLLEINWNDTESNLRYRRARAK